jgi:Tfp pilus assembly PilM family ATPase
MKRRLPLGVDLGATRIRIAELAQSRDRIVINAVEALDIPIGDDRLTSQQMCSLLRDHGLRGRRCVIGLGEPSATLRRVALPPMADNEHRRAARYEAARYVPDVDRAVVTTTPLKQSRQYALGIASSVALNRRVAFLRAAGLHVAAVDYDGFAFMRAFPDAQAVLDVGLEQARLYVLGGDLPLGTVIEYGGRAFSDAIARAFGIGERDAEERKRSIGTMGIDDSLLAAFCRSVSRAMRPSWRNAATESARLVLCGNGARIPELVERLAGELHCIVALAGELRHDAVYPRDVIRANAPAWALAVGLALHDVRTERSAA